MTKKATGKTNKGKPNSKKREKQVDLPKVLLDYFDRIGAEVLSFRKAMVREYSKGDNYYVERTFIKINPDGTLDVSRAEHEPNEREAAEIKAAISAMEFPKSVGASLAGFEIFLAEREEDAETFFPLWDRKSGLIRMVQQRVDYTDGRPKDFFPWTYFSDGEWRRMEPDGSLPFYKPQKKLNGSVMIHEGCKAARFAHALVNDPSMKEELKTHPWGDMLALYEHWGMIGGALAPQRTDYDELRRERPTEVIYVCDNDPAGTAALQKVSRFYGGQMKGITFGENFPLGFDIADELPESMFKGSKYIGKPLKSYLIPATWATEIVVPEKGDLQKKPYATLKPHFVEEWKHCVQPEVFVHTDIADLILTGEEFNNRVAPFSDTRDVSRMLQKNMSSKATALKYIPALKSGVFGEGGRFFNTHVPSDIKAKKGNPQPWLDYLDHLVPDEGDRLEVARWCATLIARPDIKMQYGMLLISETQGVGKSTLGERVLAPLMGATNVSQPSEKMITGSNFNYWLAHKRLAVVHEIYAGHSAKAYNDLKSVITEDTITVSKKYQADYEIDNWCHMLACSNSIRAIHLSADDRRWFVPKVTEEKKPKEYWRKFNEWLIEGDGLRIIKWWAEEFLKKNDPVMKGDDAPWSTTKAEMVEESYSPGMALVAKFMDKVNWELNNDATMEEWKRATSKPEKANGGWKFSGATMYDTRLVAMIRDHIYAGRPADKLERPLTVRKVAKQRGWFVHPAKVYVDGTVHGRLLCSTRALTELPVARVLELSKPLDVTKLAQEWFPI